MQPDTESQFEDVEPRAGEVWAHYQSRGEFNIVGPAWYRHDDHSHDVPAVIYESGSLTYVRPVAEFMAWIPGNGRRFHRVR